MKGGLEKQAAAILADLTGHGFDVTDFHLEIECDGRYATVRVTFRERPVPNSGLG